MRRLIRVSLVPLVIAAIVATAGAQGTSVIPGQSVGDFHLGADVSAIVGALGPLHSQDDLPGDTFAGYYWPLKRIGAIADKGSHKVVALAISLDDSYRTNKGVSAGTEMDAVRAAYGAEDETADHQDDETLIYNKLGVAFVIDKSGALGSHVSVIFVFDPGHYHDIFKEQ
jgi:hypothetical protein